MAKANYRVCWHFPQHPRVKISCRTLSAFQHKNRREAAETVLMQNPGAVVRVAQGRTKATVYRKRAGQVRRVG